MTGAGLLESSVAFAFDVTGSVIGDGALIGTVPLAFDAAGDLLGIGDLQGSVVLTLDVLGEFGSPITAGYWTDIGFVAAAERMSSFPATDDRIAAVPADERATTIFTV